MSARALSSPWLGSAIAASLWMGVAAGPASGLNAAEMAAIWGHAARQTDTASAAQTTSQGESRGSSSAAPRDEKPLATSPGR